MPDPKSYQDQNPETWLHSIPAGLILSAGVILLAMLVFTCIHTISPPANSLGLIAYVAMLTIYLIVSAGILILSMVIAARITGGIDFGYLGPLLWKSLLIVLIYTTLAFILPFRRRAVVLLCGLVLLGCFMAFFRLDKFETGILTAVNLTILTYILFVLFALLD